MTDANIVNPQITDGLTQANTTVLGNNPAYALAQTSLALAQSQGLLFANMLSTQQQQSMASTCAVTKGVSELFKQQQNHSSDLTQILTELKAIVSNLSTIESKIS